MPSTGHCVYNHAIEDSYEEEDVTIEGSPLYHYLNDINFGKNEDESIHNNSSFFLLHNHLHGFWQWTTLYEYLTLQWESVRLKLATIFPISQDLLVQMSRHYYIKYGKEVLDSKVIIEDDLDFLCLQTPQQFVISNKNEKFIFPTQTNGGNYSRYTALLSVYVVALISFLLSPVVPNSVHICLALVAVLMTCFNVRLQIIIALWKQRHDSNLNALRRFLKASECLHTLIRSSIRLIQEVEVVSRGYTLINGKTPITRIEKNKANSPRAFLKLRLNILRTCVKCTIACRRSTLELMKYKLSDDECGLDPYYICNIPLEDLGVCFIENTSSQELYQATDGYSLVVLKSLNELLRKQRSELLTRLSLALSGIDWDFAENGFLSHFTDILNEPHKTTMDCFTSLKCAFDIHKNVSFIKDENHNVQEHNKMKDETSMLRINLHSLQVHMRAAMYLSMDFEENKLTNEGFENLKPESWSRIKFHLDSGTECWERCTEQIRLMNYPTCTGVDVKETMKYERKHDDEPVETIDLQEEDADFEDQIFEATVEETTEDRCNRTANVDDELSNKKVQEESAIVIRELQSVLSVMTSEKQREMWKRQLFPSYRRKKEAADGNTDDTPGNPTILIKSCEDNESSVSEDENISAITCESLHHDEGSIDVGCEETLKFARRAAPPGRPPSTLHRRFKSNNPHSPGDLKTNESKSSFTGKNNTHDEASIHDTEDRDEDENRDGDDTGDGDDLSSEMDWAVGLGLGFSNSLALQAANVAKNRRTGNSVLLCQSEQSITYGDVDDES